MDVHHIGVWATDVEKARSFYEGVIGLVLEREYLVSAPLMKSIFGVNGDCRVTVYSGDGVRVEVFAVGERSLSGLNHLCLSVGDRRQFFLRAKAGGADCLEVMRGDHPVYFIRGPGGVLMEIKD